jgi:septum formation protein
MSQILILASTSPYRRDLLTVWACRSKWPTPKPTKPPLPGETPSETALRLSEAKARAVAGAYRDALIIGSDQVAETGRRVFGKPGNHGVPSNSCEQLSGKTVNFFTGLCLFNTRTGKRRAPRRPDAGRFPASE